MYQRIFSLTIPDRLLKWYHRWHTKNTQSQDRTSLVAFSSTTQNHLELNQVYTKRKFTHCTDVSYLSRNYCKRSVAALTDS